MSDNDVQPSRRTTPTIQCGCNAAHLTRTFEFTERPSGETPFATGEGPYERFFDCCNSCGHWFSCHAMSLDGLYDGAYVDTTYGVALRTVFERIIAIPPEQSDNFGRSQRIQAFALGHLEQGQRSLLDIGAGTGVFPYAMSRLGWNCTAMDPDPRACDHLRERVGVAVIVGELNSIDVSSIGLFDLVTLNKVIEHVADPVSMLSTAARVLTRNGLIYVEVPDGSAAARLGKERQEFFVEHLHAFSFASLALTIERAGLWCLSMDRLTEPSGKRTLFAFASSCEERTT